MGVNPVGRERMASILAWDVEQRKAIEKFMSNARQILLDAGFSQDAVIGTTHSSTVGTARDILEESKKDYDAVVVGRVGLSKIKDLILGSVAMKLIEKLSHLPLWVIGGKPPTGKIMVAMDSSEGALRAVDYVGEMVGGSDVDITLIHAIRNIHTPQFPIEVSFKPEEEKIYLDKTYDEMQAAFETAKNRLAEAGVDESKIRARIIPSASSRSECIVSEARNGGYGTIVVGRRGLSKVMEFFMGRVSNKVLYLGKEMAVWVVS
jgi:nucleotide-binding universal stress UspA family protein